MFVVGDGVDDAWAMASHWSALAHAWDCVSLAHAMEREWVRATARAWARVTEREWARVREREWAPAKEREWVRVSLRARW
jgi:hypothetical protein